LESLVASQDYDLVVADGEPMMTSNVAPMVQALQRARPAWARRTVVIGSLSSESDPTHCLAKPLDVRRLRQLAEEIFAES
jgi:hypothetical protein